MKNSGQKGAVTILLVLLLGLAAAALVYSQVSDTGKAQSINKMLQQKNKVDARGWLIAEGLRKILADAVPGYVAALNANTLIPVTIASDSNFSSSVKVVSNRLISGSNELEVEITVYDSSSAADASSSSRLRTTYLISPIVPPCNSGPDCQGPVSPASVFLRGNFRSVGALNLAANSSLFIDGDIDLGSSNLAIKEVCATGKVTIGSRHVEHVCSNGDLTLQGSGSVGTAEVAGDVKATSSGSIKSLTSNGSVNISNGLIQTLRNSGNVVVSENARIDSISTEGNVNWTSLAVARLIQSNGSVLAYRGSSDASRDTVIKSRSNVTMSGKAGRIEAMGNVDLNSSFYDNGVLSQLLSNGDFTYIRGTTGVAAGQVYGSISPTIQANAQPRVNVQRANASLQLDIPVVVVNKVSQNSSPKVPIDANTLREYSNYIFTADTSGNIKVRVKQVSSFSDTVSNNEYYFAPYHGTSVGTDNNYLCDAISGAGASSTCTAPDRSIAKSICAASVVQNACVTYDSRTKTWTVRNSVFAAGLVWFEGNLVIDGGNYTNVFAATGNITVGGGGPLTISSLNYAGESIACNSLINSSIPAIGRIANHIPTNFCAMSDLKFYENKPLGNIVLIAGSFVDKAFYGGKITLKGSGNYNGTIMAGDYVVFGSENSQGGSLGDVVINGKIIESNQSGNPLAARSQSGSLTINTNIDPRRPYFDPGITPCMSGCLGASISDTNGSAGSSASQGTVNTGSIQRRVCSVGCTAGNVSEVHLYWSSYD